MLFFKYSHFKTNVIFVFISFYLFPFISAFSQSTVCRLADSSEIVGSSDYSVCFGTIEDLEVSAESIQSPVFYWYEDKALSSLVFVGNVFQFKVTESKDFYVAVEGTGVCKSQVEGAKKIAINVIDLPIEPLLPGGNSYFSAQGIGLNIKAELDNSQSPLDFDLVFLNSFDQEIHVGENLQISSFLPRGTYYYTVLSRSKVTGCTSQKINFSVIVEDPNIKLENCSSASSSTIPNLNCPGCNVTNPGFAIDPEIATFSQVSTISNTFNGYIGQNLIFPNLGYQGDTVKIFLSFPDPAISLSDLSSISFTLMNGTRKVSKNEFFLNSPLLSVKNNSGIFVFSFLADLVDQSEPYVSVLVKSYSSYPKIVPLFNIHLTEIILATPVYPSDPITICEGESALLSVQKGENTYLRWYAEKDNLLELGSGSDFQSPILDTPGLYTFWLAVFRSNCESPVRIPIDIQVFPRPKSSDIIVEYQDAYCAGDLIQLIPKSNEVNTPLISIVSFNWYLDPLGKNRVPADNNSVVGSFYVTKEGQLISTNANPGDYVFYLSSVNSKGCETSPGEFKKVVLKVNPYPVDPVFASSSLELCEDDYPSISSLNAYFNTQFEWFLEDDSPLSVDFLLVNGGTYYARSISNTGCLSLNKIPLVINLKNCLPILTITKSIVGTEFIAGESLKYSIELKNSGIKTSYDLVLTDTLPAGTSFVGAQGGGVYSSGVVSWRLDSLVGGDSREFFLDLAIDADLRGGTVVVNKAFTKSKELVDGPISSTAPGVLVNSRPELSLSKELVGGSQRYVGDEISYVIKVSNAGPSTAYEVELSDVLPEFLGYLSSTSGTWNGTDRKVSWKIARLGVGETLEFALKVRALAAVSGFINQVSIKGSDGSETGPEESGPVTIEKKFPVLALSKVLKSGSSTEAAAGEKISYQITLSNSGLGTSYDLVLTDTLPAGTSFVGAQGGGVYSSGVVSWRLDSLVGGDSREFFLDLAIDADVRAGTELINKVFTKSRELLDGPISSTAPGVLVSSRPELSLSKELVGGPQRYVGDEISYVIKISNAGPSTAYEVELSDVLPDFLGYLSSTSGEWNGTDRKVSWKIARLGVGETLEFALKVRALGVVSGFINQVSIKGSDGSETGPEESGPVTIEKKFPVLALSKRLKSGSSTGAAAGEKISYQITLSNSGLGTSYDLVLTDTLPAGTSFVGAQGGGVYSSGVVSWLLDSLVGGDSREFFLDLAIDADVRGGTVVVNKAFTKSKELVDGPISSTAPGVLVSSRPELSLSKELVGGPQRYVGDEISYVIKVSNAGPSTAYEVELSDVLPEFLGYLSSTSGEWNGTDRKVSWKIARLGVGETLEFALKVRALAAVSGFINQVSIKGSDGSETGPEESGPVTIEKKFPVLALSKRLKSGSSTEAAAGEKISYQITLSNSGLGTSYDLVLTDTLPAGTSFVGAQGGGVYSSGVVSWLLDSLVGGDSREFFLDLAIDADVRGGTVVVNKAFTKSKELVDGPISSTAPGVLVNSRPELSLSKELVGGSQRYVGDEISYVIKISNAGPSTAYEVELSDVLPEFLDYLSSTSGEWNGTDRKVSWKIARLGVGETLEFELKVRALAAVSGFINQVSIKGSDGSETGPEESGPVTIEKKFPVLALSKVLKSGSSTEAAAGEKISYQITLSNSGLGTSYDLVLTDTLPAGTSFVGAQGGGVYSSGVVTWRLDSLVGGDSREFFLDLAIDADVRAGTVVVNKAFTKSKELVDGPISSTAPGVLVNSRPELSLSKELVGGPQRYVGDEISYVIRIGNAGPSTAYEVELSDVLPEFLGYLSSTSGEWNGTDRKVSWKIARLGVGETLEFELKVRALAAFSGFKNSVTLKDISGNTILESFAESLSLVNKEVNFLVEKTIDPKSSFMIGDTVIYKIIVQNLTDHEVDGINLVDSLDSKLRFIESNYQESVNNSNVLIWDEVSLQPNEILEIIYKALIPDENELIGSVIKNTVYLNLKDSNISWNSSVEFIVTDQLSPIISAKKSSDQEKYNLGDIVDYTIEISNLGNTAAYDVRVKDIFPMELMFLGITGEYDIILNDDSIEFIIPKIDENETVEIHLSFLLEEFKEELVNQLQVSGKGFEPVSISSNPIKFYQVDLEITKEVETSIVKVGSNFNYILRVINNSNDPATDIIVIDSLPSQVDGFKLIDGPGTVDFNQSEKILTWSIPRLEPGDSVRLEFEVTAKILADQVINQAFVTSKEIEILPEDNKSSTVHAQLEIKIPNVFTPNNDGFNDFMEIKGIEFFPNNRLLVINRWGVQVYKADNYQNDWNGSGLNEGVYFYTFSWKENIINKEVTGYITIIRD